MRPAQFPFDTFLASISIHAPRERCDGDTAIFFLRDKKFQSTHRVSDAPLGITYQAYGHYEFQSTHRVSDATGIIDFDKVKASDFNPRTA